MKTVGSRKDAQLVSHASGDLLKQVALFSESLSGFAAVRLTPKGVRRFKTHELANMDMDDCIARGIAARKTEGG